MLSGCLWWPRVTGRSAPPIGLLLLKDEHGAELFLFERFGLDFCSSQERRRAYHCDDMTTELDHVAGAYAIECKITVSELINLVIGLSLPESNRIE